jgi:hypothetical protein
MEGYCSTGQSPQWVVVPVEEEEEKEEEEVIDASIYYDYYVSVKEDMQSLYK